MRNFILFVVFLFVSPLVALSESNSKVVCAFSSVEKVDRELELQAAKSKKEGYKHVTSISNSVINDPLSKKMFSQVCVVLKK